MDENFLKLLQGCGIDSRYYSASFKDLPDCIAKRLLLDNLKKPLLVDLLEAGRSILIQGESGLEETYTQLTARALALNELPVKVIHLMDLQDEYLYEDLFETQILVILSFFDSSYDINPVEDSRFIIETFLNKYLNKKKSLILHSNGVYEIDNKWWSKSLSHKILNNCLGINL